MILPLLFIASACLAVSPESDRVLAGDVAPVLPAFAALPPETPIALAPLAGSQRVFRAAELRMIAARLGLERPAGEDMCVERKLAPLEAAAILKAMSRTLPEAHIELEDFSRSPVPAGRLEFPRPGLRQTPQGAFWSGFVSYAGRRRFSVWAKVRVRVTETRVIATEKIKAGQEISPAQLRLEIAEVFPESGSFAATIEQVVGRIARRNVNAGAAISVELLANSKEVTRGERVLVEARAGAARLEMEGFAEASGNRGERIEVRNPSSKRRFVAVIQGKGRVLVERGTL